jgi:hypothetical protein
MNKGTRRSWRLERRLERRARRHTKGRKEAVASVRGGLRGVARACGVWRPHLLPRHVLAREHVVVAQVVPDRRSYE